MGSVGDYAKGQQPMLDLIREHNRLYNERVEAEWYARSFWRKICACIGRKILDIGYR